jgi:hypothetical protein
MFREAQSELKFGLLASNRHNPRRALSQFSAARVTTKAGVQVSAAAYQAASRLWRPMRAVLTSIVFKE